MAYPALLNRLRLIFINFCIKLAASTRFTTFLHLTLGVNYERIHLG